MIVEGLNDRPGAGPLACKKFFEYIYEFNFTPSYPRYSLGYPAYRDAYYLYGITKALRLYGILQMNGRDWEKELVDFFVTDPVVREPNGALRLMSRA